MRKIFVFLFVTYCICAFSQTKVDTIPSMRLNEIRNFSISLPASYAKNKDKKYPILILLDGEYLFDAFSGAISYGNYWNELPEVIIVGLKQNKKVLLNGNSNGNDEIEKENLKEDREADYSLSKETGVPFEKGAFYFDFISTELMPYLEKKYRIAPFKIVAGHDLSAGFMNTFLYKDNPIFNAYISISPEFGLEMEERVASKLAAFKKPLFYYQSVADGDMKKVQERIQILDTLIKSNENKNIHYSYDRFEGESHYSVVLHSIPNALYHIFSAYQPISPYEYENKIVTLKKDFVSYLVNKYDIIEKYYGEKMPIRFNDFSAIESAILKNNALPELENLASLAKKQYPKTFLNLYYLGKFYEKKGELAKSIKCYQSSFVLPGIGDLTKEMMLDNLDRIKGMIPKKGDNKATKSNVESPKEAVVAEPTTDKTSAQPPVEEKKSVATETTIEKNTTQPPVEENKTVVTESTTDKTTNQPPVEENKTVVTESTTDKTTNQPPVEEKKPAVEETTTDKTTTQAPVEEKKPLDTITTTEKTTDQPPVEDVKAPIATDKTTDQPPVEEKKP
jgi:hypothetical protein